MLRSLLLAALAYSAAAAALPQRAYVWQRVWTPGLREAIAENTADFAALDVLAAELSFEDGAFRERRAGVDWTTLQASGKPVAIVVRLGPRPRSWLEDAASATLLREACAAALARARTAGVEPAELQIDFDAATSTLPSYAALLRSLRAGLDAPRFSFTALPSWLDSRAFGELADAADLYVLQVHNLEKPTSPEARPPLCDTSRARVWIAAASKLGRPFRVSLPAHGYELAFTSEGSFLGLQAEGPRRTWPAGTRLVPHQADPGPLALLVGELTRDPPAHCEGLSWFRLPTEDDALAWHPVTLAAVMSGRAPEPRLELQTTEGKDGVLDLVLASSGDTSALAQSLEFRWTGAPLLAADALAGWTLERLGDQAVRLHPPKPLGPIPARSRQTIGWLRCAGPITGKAASVETAPRHVDPK